MFDPHADPHGERTVRSQGAKSAAGLILLEQKWSESVENQGPEGSQPVGKDEVGGSNPPSSSKKASKTSVFDAFCCKNAEKCVGQNVGQPPDPHRDPHVEMCGKV